MITKVLVGVDFSDASKEALTKAFTWAQRLQVPLVALHVLQPPAPLLPEAHVAVPDQEWMTAMEEHAVEHLQRWVSDFPGTESLVKWGSPAEELVGNSDRETLLVVSRRGQGGLESLLFGTTASRVVRHAPCDVLVVRLDVEDVT